jgi:hypothetical protein
MATWDQIVSDHGPAVVRLARRILGQGADAEDVAQEVFLEAFQLRQRQEVGIRVEYGMGAYPGQMVMNNFHYDVDLDPSLFNLEPPAGYTVQSMTFTAPVEEDLIRILRSVAAHSDGAFPKAITGMVGRDSLNAGLDPDLDKLAAKYGKNSPQFAKAVFPLAQKFLQGMAFVQSLKPENDWHYVGDGVKLGTPDRPIFWYNETRKLFFCRS